MSPAISILSALLLSLISGSAAGGQQRTDPVSLLRQTLRYWWKIYNAYGEEVTLGYCWADYLLKISTESPTDLSASLAATQDSGEIAGATEGRQNLFPRNVVADGATSLGETGKGKHPRGERSHARSTIFEFANDPGEHRAIASRPRPRIVWKKWAPSETVGAVSNNYTERNSRIDENEATAPTTEKSRLRASEFLLEAPRDGREFSSRGTVSHAVNSASNPGDDDKVDFGSTDPGEEDWRRQVLRLPASRRDSFVEDDASREKRTLGSRRFPFRQYSSSQKINSKVDKMLSDPAGRRAPLNNDGSSSTPSRSQSRRVNAERPRSVVKSMGSEGNSSWNPTMNSEAPRREPEELSRDSLLSPHGGSDERSFPGGSGGEAVKKNALVQMVSGSDTKKRHPQRPREEQSSRNGSKVSMIHPSNDTFSLSESRRSSQQVLHESHGFPPDPTIPQKSRRDVIQTAGSAPSLSNVGRYVEDYEDSANQSAQHSKLIALQTSRDPDKLSFPLQPSAETGIHSFVVAIFRTLKMFVQLGRRVTDVVQKNSVLACMKEYLWTKFVRWIEA